MLNRKRKKLTFVIFLAMLGLGYFSAFSNVEINFILKSYVVIMPIQAGMMIYYFFYLRWKQP